MQEKKYVIAHNPSAVNHGQSPISIAEADYYLGNLEADIGNYFSGKAVAVSVELKGHEAHITLKTNSSAINLDNKLSECLVKINRHTHGLAFVKAG